MPQRKQNDCLFARNSFNAECRICDSIRFQYQITQVKLHSIE